MIVSPRKILANPEILDHVEDPYVVVTRIERGLPNNEEVLEAINILYWRGWETVNITFNTQERMHALLKNPRAKRKNVEDA
jgi:hypothetical protein